MGRYWRVDHEGLLLNDARRDAIAPEYGPLLDDLIARVTRAIGGDVHSIVLSGSVARGLARPGDSDLNVIVVLEESVDPELVLQGWIAPAERDLARAYPALVREVQIEVWPQGEIFRDPAEFSIAAFILRTQALCLWGSSLEAELPDYSLLHHPTRVAIANDDVVQFADDLAEARAALAEAAHPRAVQGWCRHICKQMLRTGFGLVSVELGRYTRDVDLCAQDFAQGFPAQATDIQQALIWARQPTADAGAVRAFLADFGAWLEDACAAWLDRYNPARALYFRFEDEAGEE